MGGGGPCTTSKQYQKRERIRKERVARVFGADYDEKAANTPDMINPDGTWILEGPDWDDCKGKEIKQGPEEWKFVPPAKTEKESEQERVEKNLEGWPWKGVPKKLVTLAPFAFNTYEGHPFAKARDEQESSGLMKLMRISIIQEQICDLIFCRHATAWKFAATCQEATAKLGLSLGFWDISSGWFNNCEKSRKPYTLEARPGPYVPEQLGSVASVVVVTPIRRQIDPPTYTEQLDHLCTMCHCVANWSDYIRNIQLHRVPFLTTTLLSLLVPKMVNLQVLGVYKCPLIHVGCGMNLLAIIKTDRPLGKEDQVFLDFYPNFHIGPILEHGNDFAVGGFGVLWDDWRGATDKATWAIAYRLIRQAKLQGIDMYSPDTMFRKFLNDSMCHDVDETLAAMIQAFSLDELYPGHPGFIRMPQFAHHPDGTPIHQEDYASMWPDLCKAACLIDQRERTHRGSLAKFTRTNEVFRPEGYQWTMQPYPCAACCDEDAGERMLGIFFHYKDIQAFHIEALSATPPSPILCLGCRLSNDLDYETDHYKDLKRSIIKAWLYNIGPADGSELGFWNDANLPLALEQFEARGILKFAGCLDQRRKEDIEKNGFDKETQERQKPIPDKAKKAKRGNWLHAPMLGEWQAIVEKRIAIEKDPLIAQWSWYREDRYAGHAKWK